MSFKLLLGGLLSGLAIYCSNPAPRPEAASGPAPRIDDSLPRSETPVVRLSNAPAVTAFRNTANWCEGDFGENTMINPEAGNVNRRYFVLGPGVYLMNVRLGTTVASWMMRRADDGAVELFTGDNYPHCLSQRSSFHPRDNALGFEYDNERKINFSVDLQAEGPDVRVTLEFPPGSGYGFTARRCANCR